MYPRGSKEEEYKVKLVWRYLIPRFVQYLIVIFVGITIVFLVPRLTPLDPVQMTLNRVMSYGAQYLDPQALEHLRETLTDLYGLKGSILEQYKNFWKRLIKGDFGPSLALFPTPVLEVISNSLPWTVGLLMWSIVIAWFIGNIIGGIAGYFNEKKWSKILSAIAASIYPIPYYFLAIVLIILFGYLIPIFPIFGGMSIGIKPAFSLYFLLNLLKHAFLPSLSIIIIGIGWWFLSMKALSSVTKSEDYVIYAQIIGLPEKDILFNYVMKNALLPQITNLALQIGGVFNGALITEYVFAYPGLGQTLYMAVANGDFNLMMGISVISISAIATATLIIDLVYPLIDPRIHHK